ncbi:MAG: nitrilase-related carbon-nitrogen hydrolase [Phycisphaerales bacterium]|jgi:predicted amidohydrolase|nr:nitrilase-related carbon-nitrogen hydrolase [Phycisphaerales bacterium]
MSLRYHAAACQTAFDAPTHREEIEARTTRMLEMAEQAVVGYEPFFDVRLITFPEFAHAVPILDDVRGLRDTLAVEIPNAHITRYESLCRRLGCWIQTGTFLERSDDHPDVVFNTTVLVGPSGVESIYRKVNPWIPWEVHASPCDLDPEGDHFPVADTEIGRIGVGICYDWLFPEVTRELAFKGAEVLCRLSAYMDPWGATPPTDWWTLFNRARAAENTCYVVASNQGAAMRQYPPFSWPGGSMVVDYDGRVLAEASPGPGERVVVAPIDIASLRAARSRRLGHDTLAHHRPAAYTYPGRPGLPPTSHPITTASLRERIEASKGTLP